MCIIINVSDQNSKMVANVAEVTSWMKIWDVTQYRQRTERDQVHVGTALSDH